ncbi:MAG TPA: glycosyltransferase [Stellaceae bacterium]|nr:glycosyltransferase [Stellaceae bacterium]
MPGPMIAVAHLITGLETGGAERMLAQLVAGMDRGRFRSIVISIADIGPMGAAIATAGIPVYSLNIRRGMPDPRAVPRLRRVLRQFCPEILQTWLYHADLLGLAARQLGFAPHLLWNVRCTESLGSDAVRKMLSWSSGRPDAIVVNSAAGQEFHLALGYHPRRWVLLPNGFDVEQLRPDPERRSRLRAEFGWDERVVAIALPARYHPMKDHTTFLAAGARFAAHVPDARFALVGSGNEPGNPALAATIAAVGLSERVALLGERDDLYTLYPAFDIVSLSSAYGEGFPNVLGEAMSCGVPCVATDVGDCAEIIGDTGAVVPPRDPAALAAAWERLAALTPPERAARGAAARARIVENFRLDAIVSRYEALYEEVASGSAAV